MYWSNNEKNTHTQIIVWFRSNECYGAIVRWCCWNCDHVGCVLYFDCVYARTQRWEITLRHENLIWLQGTGRINLTKLEYKHIFPYDSSSNQPPGFTALHRVELSSRLSTKFFENNMWFVHKIYSIHLCRHSDVFFYFFANLLKSDEVLPLNRTYGSGAFNSICIIRNFMSIEDFACESNPSAFVSASFFSAHIVGRYALIISYTPKGNLNDLYKLI